MWGVCTYWDGGYPSDLLIVMFNHVWFMWFMFMGFG